MKKKIYTIGYAHHTQEAFLQLLKKYQIDIVIDVRTMAYSKFHPQFNKEPIKKFLNDHGLLYRQMDEAFGIVRPHSNLLNEAGYLDFTKLAKLPAFIAAVNQLSDGIEKGYKIAFMCAEKAPRDCHRSTLVGRAFSERGYEVLHILSDGSLETHEALEEELIEKHFPNSSQVDLFGYYKKGQETLDKAYELQSNEIASTNGKRVLKSAYTGK